MHQLFEGMFAMASIKSSLPLPYPIYIINSAPSGFSFSAAGASIADVRLGRAVDRGQQSHLLTSHIYSSLGICARST